MKPKLNEQVSGKVSEKKSQKYSGKTAVVSLTPDQIKTLERLAQYKKKRA